MDIAFLHAPYDDLSGFDTERLLTQDQVAVLPRAHPLRPGARRPGRRAHAALAGQVRVAGG